jgi:hypothetical protein
MTPKIEIEVRETLRRLIVRTPGTAYAMEFAQTGGRLGLVSGFGHDDAKAAITSQQFAVLAEQAAKEKAHELGWSPSGEELQKPGCTGQKDKR